MRYLIDTNIIVYIISDPDSLDNDVKAIISDPDNTRQDHRDPSDHVIISHAITEHMPLISSDTRFGYYRAQGLDFIYNKR